MKTNLSANRQKGILLLEAMIAILLFSVGVLAVVGLQANAIKNVAQSKFRSDGAFLANQLLGQMWSDRAKYSSNALWQATAEENKATAQGIMTYFGTYSVSEADRTIAIHIEASSFPNWNEADQTRIFAIAGDQLTLTTRALGGSGANVVWTRAK